VKPITVNIPEPYLRAIDSLVRRKVFPNRAEAIRVAIRDLIRFHEEHTPMCKVTGVRTICEAEGCNNVADEHLISGDELFPRALKIIRGRKFIESRGFDKVIIGLCKKHYEFIRRGLPLHVWEAEEE